MKKRKEREAKTHAYRKGIEVVKTTIEFEKELYGRLRVAAVKSGMNNREYISIAVSEKLSGSTTDPETVQYNETGRKLMSALSKEFPGRFPELVISAACKETGISVGDLKPGDVGGPLREAMLKYVFFYSGEIEKEVMNAHLDEIFKLE